MTETALIASTKLVSLTTCVMISISPCCGANAGLPPTPTLTANVMMEDKILAKPTQPTHDILSRVWMDENPKLRMAPITTNATVQVAFSVMALRATENDKRPAPAIATCSS